MTIQTTPRLPGRPRCEATKAAILAAARGTFAAQNLRELTIESIAREAGVSKATIYRWWKTKADLVMDACIELLQRDTTYGQGSDAATIITDQIRRLIAVLSGPVGRMLAQLLAEGLYEPDVSNRFYDCHIRSRRDSLAHLLGGCADEREFLVDRIYGPIYFRLLVQHHPLDQDFADRLCREAAQMITAWQDRHAQTRIASTAIAPGEEHQ